MKNFNELGHTSILASQICENADAHDIFILAMIIIWVYNIVAICYQGVYPYIITMTKRLIH